MAKSTTKAVNKSRKKNSDAGGVRLTSIVMTPQEAVIWQAWLNKFPEGRGQKKKAFAAMLRLTEQANEPSKAEVMDWIDRNTQQQ